MTRRLAWLAARVRAEYRLWQRWDQWRAGRRALHSACPSCVLSDRFHGSGS